MRQSHPFRPTALERLSSPERLDQLIEVTSPRGWLALAGVCSLLVLAVGWGILGRLPTVVPGEGLLIRDGGIQTVAAPVAGQVTELLVGVGDWVQQEQPVARVLQVEAGRTFVATTASVGRVMDLRVSQGDVLSAGTPLLSVELPGKPLEAILYLPPVLGKRVRPDMQVQVSPATVGREEYGVRRAAIVA
jgi:multidrug efflux pump subunit AcrA (membrane-fusion protein)